MSLPDVAKQAPLHPLPISRVGIRNLKIPLTVRRFGLMTSGEHDEFPTVATCDAYVSLPHTERGTHMSRMSMILQELRRTPGLLAICETLRAKCIAEDAEICLRFPFFWDQKAPVSRIPGTVHSEVVLKATCKYVLPVDGASVDLSVNLAGRMYNEGEHGRIPEGRDVVVSLSVTTVVTTCCPCSKEISQFGAHNQRGRITQTVEFCPWTTPASKPVVTIEELVENALQSASAPIYSVLKRTDEKHVTEEAYSNPKFVEDVARETIARLRQKFHGNESVLMYTAEVQNEESIHLHDAYAHISSVDLE